MLGAIFCRVFGVVMIPRRAYSGILNRLDLTHDEQTQGLVD